MSSSNLPPVRHLPHWTRVGRLGKPSSPRHLPAANHLQPLTAVPSANRGVGRAAELSCHTDMDPRVASLQRNIQFLQQQHTETLERLHAEIEYLRRENKGEESCAGEEKYSLSTNEYFHLTGGIPFNNDPIIWDNYHRLFIFVDN